MIYLKTEINGVMTDVDLYEEEFYSTCFKCGKEHQLDVEMIIHVLQDPESDFPSTSFSCGCHRDETEKPTLTLVK